MSVNVQFREAEETVAFVQSLGLKPSELAKASFEKEVRRLRAEEWGRKLAGHKVKWDAGEATRVVREMRDSR
jgi:hypothetical protein